ncbi:Uncharacterised protein [Mycobacterium tuberculosis]|nr:Uncharacterised protein [Mycobacterium tuberculosis]
MTPLSCEPGFRVSVPATWLRFRELSVYQVPRAPTMTESGSARRSRVDA